MTKKRTPEPAKASFRLPPDKAAKVTLREMPLASLKAHPKNPRRHPDKGTPEWNALKASLEHDYFDPIVWNKRNGRLVSGHLRTKVLIDSGFKTADVVVVDYSEPVHVARMIGANRNAGTDDGAALADLLRELGEGELDLGLAGFTDDALTKLMNEFSGDEGDADADPRTDEIKQLQKKWNTKRGQLWRLGPHRLMCGDSTDPADVANLLGTAKPHLMVTDPPYGVNYDPAWRLRVRRADGSKIGAMAVGKVANDNEADWRKAWQLFSGDVAYVWHAGNLSHVVAESLIACGFELRSLICWAKSNFAIGRSHYHEQKEMLFYTVKRGAAARWVGGRKQTTLWKIDKPTKSETGHSTQKPIECMARPIRNNSAAGDLVYEPFNGSGTTIIACENLARACRAMEIMPGYVAVTLQRYLDATGKKPELLEG